MTESRKPFIEADRIVLRVNAAGCVMVVLSDSADEQIAAIVLDNQSAENLLSTLYDALSPHRQPALSDMHCVGNA